MLKKIWLPIKNVLKKVRDHLYRNFITEYLIPVKNQVLLESAPEFSDNTYYLYLEMLKHNYQKKYKLVWLTTSADVSDMFKRDDISYFNINKPGLINKLKLQYLMNTSKFVITCNRYYKRKTHRQTIIYLNHGQPLKDCTKLKMNYGDCDASVTSSTFFIDNNSRVLNTDPEKFIIYSPPRNDGLFDTTKDVKKIMNLKNQKIIIWLPTFRNHMDGKRVDSTFNMPLGIPIIYNEKELEKLNEYLKKNKITIILKPHFAADISKITSKSYSNFLVIYNKDLDNYNITLYELLGASDAMITDYSSVYYDYLITKKPIGLTLDDFDDYREHTGFAFDYKKVIKGKYIYDMKDFNDFVTEIKDDKDSGYKDRMSTIKFLKLDTEGNYSKKLFDYIVKTYHF